MFLFAQSFLLLQRVKQIYTLVHIILIFDSINCIIGVNILFVSVFAIINSDIQTKLGNSKILVFGILNASIFVSGNIGGMIFYNLNITLSRINMFQL